MPDRPIIGPITFKVRLLNLQRIFSTGSPDVNLGNILYQLANTTLQVPGVNRVLKHDDTFTLYGEQAKRIESTYASGDYATLVVIDNPPAPVADFSMTPSTGVMPLTVSFKDLSTGSPDEWYWNLSDTPGYESNNPNPTFTFTEPGTYTVKLIASNPWGVGEKTDSLIVTSVLSTNYDYVATGSLSLTGTVVVQSGSSSYSYQSSGSLSAGGQITVIRGFTYTASGRMTIGNQAFVIQRYTYTASGGMTTGNQAFVIRRYTYTASGGMVLGDSATASLIAGSSNYSYTGSGSLFLRDSAAVQFLPTIGTGGGEI